MLVARDRPLYSEMRLRNRLVHSSIKETGGVLSISIGLPLKTMHNLFLLNRPRLSKSRAWGQKMSGESRGMRLSPPPALHLKASSEEHHNCMTRLHCACRCTYCALTAHIRQAVTDNDEATDSRLVSLRARERKARRRVLPAASSRPSAPGRRGWKAGDVSRLSAAGEDW